MSHTGRILTLAGNERGAVLVFLALFAPVAILLATFAIDTSNWFLHQRHLQVQADAGALAAAQGFQPCNNEAIYKVAGQYSGATSVKTPTGGSAAASSPLYNQQIGGTTQANMHELVNSPTYYNQPLPVDSSVNTTNPCAAEMVDVKLTETNLPWYFNIFKSVPYINAHARVEILKETTGSGIEPLAVAETAPVAGEAYFVDEDNKDAILAEKPLTDLGQNSEGQDVWSNPTPLAVEIKKPHIGVVIALSGKIGDTKCGDPLVLCFDETAGTGPSLLHVQGWSAANSGTGSYKAPIARQVTLQPGMCSDGYFAAGGKGCTIGVTAAVDLGATPNPPGVTVSTIVGGGAAVAMTYSTTTKKWSVSGVALPKEGSNRVDLLVECKQSTAGSPCALEKKNTTTKVTLEDVQRAYAAGETGSGPITGAWIGESEGPPLDANSFEVCEAADANSCTHKLVVTVDVAGSLAAAAGFSDPIKKLRFEGTHGVRAGCPPPAKPSGSVYREDIENGCPGKYRINTSDPNCTVNTSPYECFTIGLPGKDSGPTFQAIQTRIEKEPEFKESCPNKWQNDNGGGVPTIPVNDPRILQVFIMPYGSVNAAGQSLLGNEEVPIQNFAAFYVTGFPGDTCKSDPSTGNAEVVGHFIEYVNPLGVSGENKCVASSLGECVAVLTR
jgi:Flp pilus assembly protein TadG